jgi:TrmH family RNA methyltransferase
MPTDAASDRVNLVLVRTRNPLNIGAAARAMSNFGFTNLRVVRPYDAAFREARSAVGAADVLRRAQVYETTAEAVADCTLVVGTSAIGSRHPKIPVKSLEAGARLIRKRMLSQRVAILFGSEKRGLSSDDLDHCNFLLHVPTQEEHLSMNLGQAVAVCLYELSRRRTRSHSADNVVSASAGDLERLTQSLLEAATASGYSRQTTAAATSEKFRRLVRRLRVQTDDARVLLGLARQILWKLRPQDRHGSE